MSGEDEMTQADAMTHTQDLRHRIGATITDTLDPAADAAGAGDFTQAAVHARLLRERGDVLVTAVVRDALEDGADWWTLGDVLGMHPQEAFEQYRSAREGLRSPAEQRRQLAIVLTVGVAAEHDFDDAYGIDLDDLGGDHSLHQDPTVLRLRESAALLREDIWIAVNTPGEYEGMGEAEESAVATQWTTVALHPDELAWLREALALGAGDDAHNDDEDDLEPLD